MGLIYQTFRKAVNADASATEKISDWSPNEIRGVYFTGSTLIVGYHLRPTKTYSLKLETVVDELEKYKVSYGNLGNIFNALRAHDLSGLEEFVLPSELANSVFSGDVENYCNDLKNKYRLRFFGWYQRTTFDYNTNMTLEYLNYRLNNLDTSGKNYTLSDFIKEKNCRQSLFYNCFDNLLEDYYNRINLRPQFYEKDSLNGNLAKYFKTVKEYYNNLNISKGQEAEVKKELLSENVKEKLMKALFIDVKIYNKISLYDKYFNSKELVNNGGGLFTILFEKLSECYKGIAPLVVLSRDQFKELVDYVTEQSEFKEVNRKVVILKNLTNFYHKYGCIVDKEVEINSNNLTTVSNIGLFGLINNLGILYKKLIEIEKNEDGQSILSKSIKSFIKECCSKAITDWESFTTPGYTKIKTDDYLKLLKYLFGLYDLDVI